MKTIADKNRFETELRRAPSNIRCKRESVGRGKGTAKWIALGAVCIVVVWFVAGLAKFFIADMNVKVSHLLIAFLALRWLFVRGASTLKTIILIIIITAIFN